MNTTRTRPPRLVWSLLASALALSLMLGLALMLSSYQVLAQPATEVTAANLVVQKSVNADVASPGDILTYTISIENVGDSASVWFTDELPADLTHVVAGSQGANFGTLVIANRVITWHETIWVNQTAEIWFSAQTSSDIITYSNIINTAQVTADGTLVEDSASTMVAAAMGTLSAEKTATPTTAEPGDIVTYTITLENSNLPVPGVIVTDKLPPGLSIRTDNVTVDEGSYEIQNNTITWTLDMGAHWSNIDLSFNAQVSPDIPSDRLITNTAEIAAPLQTFTTEPITISVHKRVGQLIATKTVTPQLARSMEYLTYTVHLENNGDGALGGLWMTDELPSEVTFVADTLTATWGSVGNVGNVITWTSLTAPDGTLLLPDNEVTITYRVQIGEDVSDNPHFTNTAQITGAGSLVTAQATAQAITDYYMYLPFLFRNYPPVTTIYAIPAPVNASYTVSWRDLDLDYDYYELQQSLEANFASLEDSWHLTTNSQQIQSAICAYHYRVRVVNMSAWGQGPWSSASLAQASPPIIVLNDIDNATGSPSYTVSWVASSIAVQQYVLQESKDPAFATLTGNWTIASGTSKAISQSAGSGGTFYYRVRADDDDCWGEGEWSAIKSVLVKSSYIYDFNSPTKIMKPWPVRRTTYWQGDIANVTWTEEHDGSMYFLMSDKWDAALASPMLAAPPLPYEIESKIKIRDPSNLVSYGIIFGGNGGTPCPAYRDTGCFTHYYRLNVLWHSGLQANLKRIDYHEAEKGKGRGVDLSDWVELTGWPFNVDPDGWNTWRIYVHSNGFDVYLNNLLFKSVSDTTFVNEPYFGVFTSTDEYKPSIGQYDYFYVRSK